MLRHRVEETAVPHWYRLPRPVPGMRDQIGRPNQTKEIDFPMQIKIRIFIKVFELARTRVEWGINPFFGILFCSVRGSPLRLTRTAFGDHPLLSRVQHAERRLLATHGAAPLRIQRRP